MTIDDIAARHKYTGDHFGLPWSVGPHGSDVWCQSLKGGETRHIDIRGWGYLTGQGHGALGLSADEAMTLQAQLAHRVVNSVNDVPALLAEITRLTAALADAEARGRLAERTRIIDALKYEASVRPCAEDAGVISDCALLVEADFSYDKAEEIENARALAQSPIKQEPKS